MRRRYAGAEQHMIDGSGHLPAIQRPDAVSAVLRARLLEGRRSR
jgi:pimeloyl-ACP methyl ester carboxylesterase